MAYFEIRVQKTPNILDQDQEELMYFSDQSRFPTLLSLLIYDASKKIIFPV